MSKLILNRLLSIDLPKGKSCFLWGPRKAGKSYWIKEHLKDCVLIDLLKTDVFGDYASRPALLRERFQNEKRLIVIDEVQKIPSLLDEVHWLIENSHCQFLLTGSSARKLRKGHANLLGGRAWRRIMLPLSWNEVSGFDLEKVLVSGMLPPHFLSNSPIEELRAYVADYLKEEIASEALAQNIPAFNDFLRVSAVTNGELLNYTNIARECGINQRTVRAYFDILDTTFLGAHLKAWTRSKKRRLIQSDKFYFFDVGIANYLSKRHPVTGNQDFGRSFEHFIFMELLAYQNYLNPEMPLSYWRSGSGYEVDFILGDREIALEVKSGKVHSGDLGGFKALLEDGPVKRCILISLETEPRKIGAIEILPWKTFLQQLWDQKIS